MGTGLDWTWGFDWASGTGLDWEWPKGQVRELVWG